MQMRREITGVQHRAFAFDEVEVRDATAGDGWTLEGVAAIADRPYTASDMFGEFTETITRGAFDKTLSELSARSRKGGVGSDVGLFVNHDYRSAPLATVSAGSLEVWADPHLRVRARLNPARPSVQEIRHAVNDGEMRQMSIGMKVPKGKDEWTGDGERVVREAMLVETSVVWLGDNPATSAGMRSVADLLDDLADIDDPVAIRRAYDFFAARLPAPAVDPAAAEQRRKERRDMAAKVYHLSSA